MNKQDYDTTIARIAGNLLSGSVVGGSSEVLKAKAQGAVALARAIVEEVKRTQPANPQNQEQK